MDKQSFFPIITVVLFLILVGVSVFRFFYHVRTGTEKIITQEVKQLVTIMKRIDDTCKIIDFDY